MKSEAKRSGKKVLKVFLAIIAVFLIIGISGYFYVAYHPQVVVGIIQKALYPEGKEINPVEPQNVPDRKVRENGILYVNDIKYGSTYPNSFLDISYPTEDTSVDRPTIVYFHGGGYFGGDKVMGDPLAVNEDSTYLFDRLVLEGYNLVNINYVLVPDYHFPDPVIQMNEAINYLIDNQAELGLDMGKVIIFGQSAGAIMTAQYGAILSNSDYRQLFPLTEEPKLELADIVALVIDDAPLDMANFDNLQIKLLIANYLEDSIYFGNKEMAGMYNAISYVNGLFPRSFLTAGTDDGFPEDMQELSDRLTEAGVENIYFYTPEEKYGLTMHGYLSNLKYDTSGAAKDCFDAIIEFIKEE